MENKDLNEQLTTIFSVNFFDDSFIISILESCCKINLVDNPYYQSWNEKNILSEKDEWSNL